MHLEQIFWVKIYYGIRFVSEYLFGMLCIIRSSLVRLCMAGFLSLLYRLKKNNMNISNFRDLLNFNSYEHFD